MPSYTYLVVYSIISRQTKNIRAVHLYQIYARMQRNVTNI